MNRLEAMASQSLPPAWPQNYKRPPPFPGLSHHFLPSDTKPAPRQHINTAHSWSSLSSHSIGIIDTIVFVGVIDIICISSTVDDAQTSQAYFNRELGSCLQNPVRRHL